MDQKFTRRSDQRASFLLTKTIKIWGGFEDTALVPLHHIATSKTTTGDLVQTTISFAFPHLGRHWSYHIRNQRSDLLKALQDAGISLTVVGETRDKKKTLIQWSMEQMVFYLDIRKFW